MNKINEEKYHNIRVYVKIKKKVQLKSLKYNDIGLKIVKNRGRENEKKVFQNGLFFIKRS